jgi:hypothetical protein
VVSPAAVSDRVEKRVHRMFELAGLKERPRPQTIREWEVRWNTRDLWKQVTELLDGFQCDVILHGEAGTDHSVTMAVLHETERDSIVLVESTLKDLVNFCRQEGLEVPLTPRDMAIILSAREYYLRLARKVGNQPLPWVDELGGPTFVQGLLGLPFNPLVVDLLQSQK